MVDVLVKVHCIPCSKTDNGEYFDYINCNGFDLEKSFNFYKIRARKDYILMTIVLKDSGNSSSRFFVYEFHIFHYFVIFNDIDFKFSAVVDNNITFDLREK